MKKPRKTFSGRYGACIALGLLVLTGHAQAAPMVFVAQAFPPFVADQQGRAEGPFPDVVRAVCEAMKVPCTVEIYPWRRALRMAEEGEADGILVIQKLPERERYLYLTGPIVQSAYSVFATNTATIMYRQPMDLEGYTLGAYGPSATSQTAESIAQAAPSIKLIIEIDNATVLRKLSARRYGERAVGVMNVDVGNYLIKRDGIAGLKVIGEIKKIEYLIGLSRRKLSAKQAEEFNAALRELTRKNVIKAIIEKYGMAAVSP